jgi:hypothetical protein
MAKYEESKETPDMEAEHHSTGFLKKAVKKAKKISATGKPKKKSKKGKKKAHHKIVSKK